MSNILVVDDAAADRALAGHLLSAQSGWTVAYAPGGQEALERLTEGGVDLVLTDLVMPELDGLALVERVRDQFPDVPVVLMTAKGSEEIAVRALETGAASYVPKKTLAQDLVDAVERILGSAREDRSHRRMLGHLRAASFVLTNDLELISSLVSYLTTMLKDSGAFEEGECHRIATALDEALTNAYYHGNLEVRSEIREHDPRAYRALANERRSLAPYRDRCIRVDATLDPREARFVVRDEGGGFDATSLPDPTDLTNLERPSGRGVFLMQTFMDAVTYNEAGNEVTLVKRRVATNGDPPAAPE